MAVAADAVLLEQSRFVGGAERAMAVGTAEPRALDMNRVREPDVRRLAGVDKPRRRCPCFDVIVDQFGFGWRSPELVGVAGSAGFILRDAGERPVRIESVARLAIRATGLLGVRLVHKING